MEGALFLRISKEVLLRFRRPSSNAMEPCEEPEDLADEALVLRWNRGKNLDRMSVIITTLVKILGVAAHAAPKQRRAISQAPWLNDMAIDGDSE